MQQIRQRRWRLSQQGRLLVEPAVDIGKQRRGKAPVVSPAHLRDPREAFLHRVLAWAIFLGKVLSRVSLGLWIEEVLSLAASPCGRHS